MFRTRQIIAFATLAMLLGLAVWSWQQSRQPAPAPTEVLAATVLSEPRGLPDFELTDQRGRAFGPAQLRNRWSLLFFGFTRCPDICPNTLGLLKAVNSALKQTDAAAFQVVFVSVDPGHDRPETLRDYVEYFDPAFTAVTGPEPELQKLTGALYMPYAHVPVGQDGDYTVEHSGALVLLNPQAQAVAYFSPPLQVAPIANDLRSLLGHS